MTRLSALLWDFGDTLCDERFIWGSGPEWAAAFDRFAADGLGSRWNRGELDTLAFATELATRMGRPADAVIAHMRDCCQNIRFFPYTYAFFKARHLPQAIVTVNPDLFSEVIVPICGFDRDCDAIVTSWEEGTEDKRVLNRIAIERLGLDCPNAEAVLIDNKLENVDAWRGIGGAGYHYRGDERFAADVSRGVDFLSEQ